MRNNLYNASRFLLFAYFGADFDEQDILFEKIVDKAYTDATNQGALNTLIGQNENIKEQAFKIKEKVKSDLLAEIAKYNEPKGENFKGWHSGICALIKQKYDKSLNKNKAINPEKMEYFSYGNAQKWLNMTLKYSYLMGELTDLFFEKNAFFSAVKEDSKYLHIPIDRYMLDALWTDTEMNKDLFPKKEGANPKYDYPYKHPSDYLKSWSRKDYEAFVEEYFVYFNRIENEPIQWETEEWLKQAKARRK